MDKTNKRVIKEKRRRKNLRKTSMLEQKKNHRARETPQKSLKDFFKFFLKVHLGDSNRHPSLAVKILNGTPRPNVPSQKAQLEIGSDNLSRIFTTLLPQTAFINSNFLFIVYTHTHRTKHACLYDGWMRRASTPIFG